MLGAGQGVGHGCLPCLALQRRRVSDRELHAAYVVGAGGDRSADHGAHAVHVTNGDVVVVPDLVAVRRGVAALVVLLLAPQREARGADVRLVNARGDEGLADGHHDLVGL